MTKKKETNENKNKVGRPSDDIADTTYVGISMKLPAQTLLRMQLAVPKLRHKGIVNTQKGFINMVILDWLDRDKETDFNTLEKNQDKDIIKVYHPGRTSHVSPEDRTKISITISQTLLDDIDIALIKNDALIKSLGNHGNRSNMIHMALLDYLEKFKE